MIPQNHPLDSLKTLYSFNFLTVRLAFLLHTELLVFAAELGRQALYSYKLDPINPPALVVEFANQLYLLDRQAARFFRC
jgi:hypothetical protein